MGISTKSKAKHTSDTWGRGFLLVFFPEDDDGSQHHHLPSSSSSSTIVEKPPKLLASSSSFSSPSSSSPSPPSTSSSFRFRRTHSTPLLSRAQSTISICALLVCVTLLVFTLSTFEPSSVNSRLRQSNSRRLLQPQLQALPQPSSIVRPKPRNDAPVSSFRLSSLWRWQTKSARPPNEHKHQFALQRMGTLFRRGTRSMNDLVVGHLTETVAEEDLRLFLRTLHRSGLTAKADVVLIFPSHSLLHSLATTVDEENDSFSRLLRRPIVLNAPKADTRKSPLRNFDATPFLKPSKKEKEIREPLWGKRRRSNSSSADVPESAQPSYGSIVGFEVGELDPENSLSGFMDHVPMSLRRWACYPMLLGRIRRNFKHVMLIDVKGWAVLGDPLVRVRNRSPETVHLTRNPDNGTSASGKHSKKGAAVNAGVLMGGARGVRRLASAMLNEIVRASMTQQQPKKKSLVTESAVLSQLAGNEFVLGNVDLEIMLAEGAAAIAGYSGGSSIKPGSSSALIQVGDSNNGSRGNGHNGVVKGVIMKEICSLDRLDDDSSVYSDC